MRLVIASNNPKKRREMEAILSSIGVAVVPAEATCFVPVEEDGATFAENAAKKARAFAAANAMPALADDSGLCVDALGGAPGVRSSRYAGIEGDDAANNARLLAALDGVADRRARFVCALHLAFAGDRPPLTAEGETVGTILTRPDGPGGFGYDPLFFSPELGCSFARATAEEKARVSHRGRALRALADKLRGG
ncbi:MAG: RdgB/HAM1 family non-canonical purine NTP pyrophosphatase [Zetaproteobacteria bacterium]|nr:MAG: RdgB/HAM1 family non-canonical purine NTP pyrophosphatase [Zetaproteobacteria bacterium]